MSLQRTPLGIFLTALLLFASAHAASARTPVPVPGPGQRGQVDVRRLNQFYADRAPGSVGLFEALGPLRNNPQVRQQMIATLRQNLGLAVSDRQLQAALGSTEGLCQLLVRTPHELKAGASAVTTAYQARQRNATDQPRQTRQTARTWLLPRRFDLGRLAQVPAPELKDDLTPLAPGLFRGSLHNPAITREQARQSVVMAEVLQRLAGNTTLRNKSRFSVRYDGQKYNHVGDFLRALQASGHEIKVHVDHRVADFLSLIAQTPEGLKSVAAPLWVRTRVERGGQEAIVPAVHSELVIEVAPRNVKGQAVTATTRWYQGVPETGFTSDGLTSRGSWTGTVRVNTLAGAQAIEAVEHAALYSDAIHAAARRFRLPMEAYGETGVCNDTVAKVQAVAGLKVTPFPLLESDRVLAPVLAARARDSRVRACDRGKCSTLLDAVQQMRNDAEVGPLQPQRGPRFGVPSGRERADLSLPWSPGQEPLGGARDARPILSGGPGR